jgi:hypothetical protein
MCSQRTKRTDATWDLLRAYFSLRLLDRATNTGSTDNNKALRTGLQGLRRCNFPTQCGRLPPELQHIRFGGNFGANFRLGAGKQVHTGIAILQTKVHGVGSLSTTVMSPTDGHYRDRRASSALLDWLYKDVSLRPEQKCRIVGPP